jgi:hypothetical protein
MAFALLGLAFFNLQEKKYLNSIMFLTLAVSLKPQLLFSAVYLLKDRKIKHFLMALIIPIATNLVLMFTFPGNYFNNLRGYLLASTGYVSSQEAFGNIMNSISIVGIISRFFEYFNGWDTSNLLSQNKDRLIVPGVLYLFAVCLIVVSSKFSESLKLILSLSLISAIVPSSGGYLLGWSTLLTLLLFSKVNESKDEFNSWQKCLIMSLILCINTPGFVLIDNIPGFSRHIPAAVFAPFLAVLLILSEMLRFRRKIK